ncbi:hypothetical protein GCM10010151_06920 [Actinoallomurus spadix]|uniref:Uncharacterized protein n=1 Tax=Actinoallomurus spadix TaxID=79912 RepID=A0ABN0VXI8_9ACTN
MANASPRIDCVRSVRVCGAGGSAARGADGLPDEIAEAANAPLAGLPSAIAKAPTISARVEKGS